MSHNDLRYLSAMSEPELLGSKATEKGGVPYTRVRVASWPFPAFQTITLPRPVVAVALAPGDESGGVILSAPSLDADGIVGREAPWQGYLEGSVKLSPIWAAGYVQRPVGHVLDLLFYHAPQPVYGRRASLRKSLRLTGAASPTSQYVCVSGRARARIACISTVGTSTFNVYGLWAYDGDVVAALFGTQATATSWIYEFDAKSNAVPTGSTGVSCPDFIQLVNTGGAGTDGYAVVVAED